VVHGADSCRPEGKGDVLPWPDSRRVVNFASDCGLALKIIAKKYN